MRPGELRSPATSRSGCPLVGTVRVLPPDQLAFYGVLGGLAVLELIDWPVALAMGIGSAVVARHLSALEEREEEVLVATKATGRRSPRRRRRSGQEGSGQEGGREEGASQEGARKESSRETRTTLENLAADGLEPELFRQIYSITVKCV